MELFANELRIGNLLTDGKFEIEVVNITTYIIAGKTKDRLEQTYSFNIQNLIPITLTEERLLSLGFTKEENVQFYQSYDFKRVSIFEHESKFYYCANGWVEIKTIHHLQNLVFILTGEELMP